MTRVLFVCLGNICRSPIAEGWLRFLADEQDVPMEIDSCGTIAMHEGSGPDPRSVEVMQQAGLDISSQRSRPLRSDDFDRFDHILVMDESNLEDVRGLAPNDLARSKVVRLLGDSDVPDPYYGGDDGFVQVRELVRAGISDWLSAQPQSRTPAI